jgi:hypothetical protein
MPSLYESISQASTALQSLNPSALTHENLESVQGILGGIEINALLDEYAKELPAKPGDEDKMNEYRRIVQNKADELNKRIDPLLEALDSIKKIRMTLNLPALDPVIQAAQKIIRTLFDFSSSMQE